LNSTDWAIAAQIDISPTKNRIYYNSMTRRTILTMLPAAAAAQEVYKFGPDSERHEGIPKGAVTKLQFKSPKIFPGTVRDYWVYVPAQYKAE